MNWVVAVSTGAGLGLVNFGALWLTVHRAVTSRYAPAFLLVSALVRFALVGLVFYALSLQGAGVALAALVGFWLARVSLARRIGGAEDGE